MEPDLTPAPAHDHEGLGAVNDTNVKHRLRAHGAELVGELVQYENSYRLCYVRGPEGILVALAEKFG
jgi:hypothetical protein